MPITRRIRQISLRISNLLASIISIFSLPISSRAQTGNALKKIAFFTEGQTERIFLEKLLVEVAGSRNIAVETRQMMGGRRFQRIAYTLTRAEPNPEHKYYALIVDCGTDGRVASDIREQYPTLVNSGYSAIVAIRDVAPDFQRTEIAKLRAGIEGVLPKAPLVPTLVLATMEVEAWFIGEHTHFPRIDAVLSVPAIRAMTGLDLMLDNIEGYPTPAENLDLIYGKAGLNYSKSRADVERTVNALDFGLVQTALSAKAPSIEPLMRAVGGFFQ
jgi:hypothetical protein